MKSWADFPYVYNPKKNLTNKELNELMKHMFSVKVFPEHFYEDLPDNLKQHFDKRKNPEEPHKRSNND